MTSRSARVILLVVWTSCAMFLLGWGYYMYLNLTFFFKHGGY